MTVVAERQSDPTTTKLFALLVRHWRVRERQRYRKLQTWRLFAHRCTATAAFRSTQAALAVAVAPV